VAAEDLVALAADAARRALELCRGAGDGGLGLAPEADLPRLAAERLRKPDFDGFAARAQVAPRALMRLALTWAAGGAAALEVLNGAPWKPPPQEVEEGSAALRRVSGGATVRGERVSNGRAGVQLRYGRDGLWYLLVRRFGVWEIHDPPAADPEQMMSLVPAQTAAIAPSPLVRSGVGGSVDHAPRHVAGGAGEVAGGRRRRARQARVSVPDE
jgi:hypothetical protein